MIFFRVGRLAKISTQNAKTFDYLQKLLYKKDWEENFHCAAHLKCCLHGYINGRYHEEFSDPESEREGRQEYFGTFLYLKIASQHNILTHFLIFQFSHSYIFPIFTLLCKNYYTQNL